MEQLYQVLDEEGYDPIGQALEMHEVVMALTENPTYTFRECDPVLPIKTE